MLGAFLILVSLLNLRLGWLALRADSRDPSNRYFAALSLVDAIAAALRGGAASAGQPFDTPGLVVLGLSARVITSYLSIGLVYSMTRRNVPPRWLRALVVAMLAGTLVLWHLTHHLGVLWLWALFHVGLSSYVLGTGVATLRERYGSTSTSLFLLAYALRLSFAFLLLATASAERAGLVDAAWFQGLLAVERPLVLVVVELLMGYAILHHHLFNIRGLLAEFVVQAGFALAFVGGVVLSVDAVLARIYPASPLLGRVALCGLCLVTAAALQLGLRLQPWLRRAVVAWIAPQHEARHQALEQAQRELATMQRELGEAQHLATLGTLAAAIAHDLRTPLTSVQMNVQILRNKVSLPQRDMEHFELALTEISRLNAHVNELLDYAKPVRLHRAPADLRELCDEALGALAALLEERALTVERHYPATLSPLHVDAERLRKVLTNLLSNSISASSRGGSIEVALTELPAASELPHGGVAITVTDHGRGISEPEMSRLFEPFYTTRSDGIGLGLSIVRKLVQAHGGEVEVRSPGGRGASFTVRLPRQAATLPMSA